MVTGAKLATLVASAVGFGAIAGLIIANPVGARATTPAASAPAAEAPAQLTPAATQAADFFAVPPGFVQAPMVDSGSAGQSGTSGSQGGFGGQSGTSGSQGGFGGQMPGMRTGGS
jgi:hypothetical protein